MLLFFVIFLVFVETNISMNKNTVAAATPNTINWSGYTWYVQSSEQQRVYPGPNYWSSNAANVWVDANGWLHLKITNRNGRWYSAEVWSTQTMGYGTYVFYTVSHVDTLDKNVVLGLFAYKDDNHEVDIEYSKWSNPTYNNGWFSIQPAPFTQGKNQQSFNLQLSGTYSTHYFTWKPGSVYFEVFGGHYPVGTEPAGNIVKSFTSYKTVDATGVRAHINLWLFNGKTPSNAQPAEVIIKSFQFIPLK